jgi:DNA-binding MarR family transcriptional regulator
MKQTSLDAYDDIKETLNRREEEVLEALGLLGQATNNEIADMLDWQINRVTGRTNSLAKKNYIEECDRRPDKFTGYKSIVWRIKNG